MKIWFVKIDSGGPILRFKELKKKGDITFCLIGWEPSNSKKRPCLLKIARG